MSDTDQLTVILFVTICVFIYILREADSIGLIYNMFLMSWFAKAMGPIAMHCDLTTTAPQLIK